MYCFLVLCEPTKTQSFTGLFLSLVMYDGLHMAEKSRSISDAESHRISQVTQPTSMHESHRIIYSDVAQVGLGLHPLRRCAHTTH